MNTGWSTARPWALAAAVLAAILEPPTVDAAQWPAGFREERIAVGLTGATGMAVSPDGRIFICEQTGSLRVVKDGLLLEAPFLTVSTDSYWERGLIGVALDPAFPERPWVYVNYVSADPHPHHRISRFTASGDAADPRSEVVLLEGDDQRRLGGSIPAGHQGGGAHFGPDGMLYIGIGEQTAGAPAQDLGTFQGKVLRIRPDGSIPEDNPFFTLASGKYRAIWALGFRNPFAFAFEPRTGRLFINDVGGGAWEEVNEGVSGGNYGWPAAEGEAKDARFRDPVHAYGHGLGKSITGGVFCDERQEKLPPSCRGKYLFADFDGNWIRTLDPGTPGNAAVLATGLHGPVDLSLGPNGRLYVLNRNAWVKDEKFKPGAGYLLEVEYDPAGAANSEPQESGADAAPRLLSETRVFRSVETLEPGAGFVEYTVQSPLWSDGARKRRWISLPPGKRIEFAERGEWKFPGGTVLVKHFEEPAEGTLDGAAPPLPRRLETRILWADGAGGGHGRTYRWRPDQRDAELLDGAATETIAARGPPRERPRTWYYPSPADCLACHTRAAGFVLGVNTRQLNGPFGDPAKARNDNQLLAWSRLGMLEPRLDESKLGSLERLRGPRDSSATIELRVRSYLDSNCGHCHRPGGARGLFDARFDTPLRETNIIGGGLAGGDLGTPGSRAVLPRDVARSALLQRMKRLDVFKMPPLAMNEIDETAVAVLEEWILGLPEAP